MKPICYLRMLDGKPDWSEDCVSEDEASLTGGYPQGHEGYTVIPLYALPKGWVLVPKDAPQSMLRQFIECPADEVGIAWEAALHVCARTVPVVDMEGHVRAVASTGND